MILHSVNTSTLFTIIQLDCFLMTTQISIFVPISMTLSHFYSSKNIDYFSMFIVFLYGLARFYAFCQLSYGIKKEVKYVCERERI